MNEQIAAGSVVQLKSGGPYMTVSKLREWQGRTEACCDWFEGTKQHDGMFPLTSLKVITEDRTSGVFSGGAGLGGGPNAWMG